MCPLPDLSRSLLALRPASDLNWRSAAQRKATTFLIAADEPEIEKAAASLREDGTEVEALQADLATTEGVDKLYAAVTGRQVDALLANAGRGLGHAFLDLGFCKDAAGHGCRAPPKQNFSGGPK